MPTPPNGSTSPRGTTIAHVGIAVAELAALLPFFRDVLGMSPVAPSASSSATIEAVQAGDSLVELLQSSSDGSPIAKFVARRGPGIHHICFAVDDLDAMLDRCRTAGIRLIDETPRLGAERKRIAFLHPGSTGGVLVELSEY
jgi:methylmalonyl-CoA/ethylmalonyl-CoA epimerase